MVNIHHIQYSVGQGGLHLGIIGDYAYVYDCGGYGVNVNWPQIFNDVVNKLSKVDTLDIFIPHLHKDHYNNTVGLISTISNTVQEINIYLPPMNDIEKIMLICEYHADIDDSDEKFDDEYINLVLTGKFADIKESKKIKYVNIFTRDKTISDDIILRSYTTNISSCYQKKFERELNINPADLASEIQRQGNKFWHMAINAFKNVFKAKRVTNHIMLTLYCGKKYQTCCRDKINWLHTGDAYMTTYRQLEGFVKAFEKLLSNVNFAQIPHHGSQNNHDCKFAHIFNCCCYFYYTTQDKTNKYKGITKSHICDLNLLPCRQILPVSDNPLTQLKL
ncbi:MAG: hypothetical protein IJS26_01960 [Alphaproteobacteria bacterium]|nr:hypothetical protein [Alphaproteobacteria bacterium]